MVRHQKDIFVIIEYRLGSILRVLISLWRTFVRRELGLAAEGFPWRSLVPPYGLGKYNMALPFSLTAKVNFHGKSDSGRVEAVWGGTHNAEWSSCRTNSWQGRQICGTISEKYGTKTPFSLLPFSYILEKPQISLSSIDAEMHGWMDLIPLAQSTTMHVNWC